MTLGSLDGPAHAVLLASFPGPAVPAWLRRRAERGLGGVALYGGNRLDEAGTARAARTLRASRPELLVAADEEGGDVTRLWAGSGSPVPGNLALGTVDDTALTGAVAGALGAALLTAGVDLALAPVADVNVDPRNPAIGVRSFGDEAELVSRHVAATVTGLQAAGVAACAKHFPGHGATTTDSHASLPVLDAGRPTLEQRELRPFRAAIEAGVAAVMTGHLMVPALDERPATYSPAVIGDLLRVELGFRGAVVTDALDMGGAGRAGSIPANVVRALAAGADLCCLGPDGTDDLLDACVRAIDAALRAGDLTGDRLLDAAGRVARIRRPWPHHVGPGRPDADALPALGLTAARRALRVEGLLADPVRGAHVVELERPPMVAAGDVPWGIGSLLAAADLQATVERVDPARVEPDEVERLLAAAAGRPLVVAVRDAPLHPAQAALARALLGARPDAVVVDLGWPDGSLPAARARVVTQGASAASARAAAELLAEGAASLTETAPPARTTRG